MVPVGLNSSQTVHVAQLRPTAPANICELCRSGTNSYIRPTTMVPVGDTWISASGEILYQSRVAAHVSTWPQLLLGLIILEEFLSPKMIAARAVLPPNHPPSRPPNRQRIKVLNRATNLPVSRATSLPLSQAASQAASRAINLPPSRAPSQAPSRAISLPLSRVDSPRFLQ
jgi:hypothetical protein